MAAAAGYLPGRWSPTTRARRRTAIASSRSRTAAWSATRALPRPQRLDGADRLPGRRPDRDRHGRVVLGRRSAFADEPAALAVLGDRRLHVPVESGAGRHAVDLDLRDRRDPALCHWPRMGFPDGAPAR